MKELAVIEESLDLNTDRKHFKRKMQMEGQSEDKVKEHVNSDYQGTGITQSNTVGVDV